MQDIAYLSVDNHIHVSAEIVYMCLLTTVKPQVLLLSHI